MEKITFHLIDIIVTLKKHNSLTKTARQFYISEPALSKKIKEAERKLGYHLITRSSKGCSLTDAGELLALEGDKLLLQRNRLQRRMDELSKPNEKDSIPLRFGISECYASTILPTMMAPLLAEISPHPLQIISKPTDILEQLCLTGNLDVIVTQKENCPKELCFEAMRNEEIMIYITRSLYENHFDVSLQGSIELSKLALLPYAEGEGHERYGKFASRFFKEAGFKPKIVFTSDNWPAILKLMEDQSLYSLMPNIFTVDESKIIRLSLMSRHTHRVLGLACLPSSPFLSIMQRASKNLKSLV